MSGFKLSTDMLDDVVGQIKAVDAKLEGAKGTAAERRTAAVAALKAEENHTNTDETIGPFARRDILADQIAALRAELDEAEQNCKDAVVTFLKSSKDETSAEVDTLKAQRAELVTNAQAMATLLKVDLPAIGKAPRVGTSSGGGKAKTSTGSHYIVREGSRHHYANDTFSGLAWYAFKRASVVDLTSAITEAGVSNIADPWEVTVTLGEVTATVGHEVTPDETSITS